MRPANLEMNDEELNPRRFMRNHGSKYVPVPKKELDKMQRFEHFDAKYETSATEMIIRIRPLKN